MENKKKKRNIIFIIAIIILNISTFTDFLPYNTIYKVIAFALLIFCLLIEKNEILKMNKLLYSSVLMCFIVFLNIFAGGDITFIITFIVNFMILILLTQFSEFSKIEVKIIAIICLIHLFFLILVEIVPVPILNTLFRRIILYDYYTNYSWRVISGINVGITGQPGVIAMYMMVLSAYFFAKSVKEKKKMLYIAGYCLSISFIFLTTKRAASLFSIITSLIMLLLYWKGKMSNKKYLRVIFIFLFIAISFYLLNSQFDIFQKILSKNRNLTIENDVSNGRLKMWQQALSLFWDSPIFGIGLKKYYKMTGFDVHNTYIQILTETGIIGFLFFAIFIYSVIKNCIVLCKKKYKNGFESMKISTIIGLYIIIFLLLYGFVGNIFIDYLPLTLFIIAICMVNNDYYQNGENV